MWNENQHGECQLQRKSPINENQHEDYQRIENINYQMENVNHQMNEYYRGNEECQSSMENVNHQGNGNRQVNSMWKIQVTRYGMEIRRV